MTMSISVCATFLPPLGAVIDACAIPVIAGRRSFAPQGAQSLPAFNPIIHTRPVTFVVLLRVARCGVSTVDPSLHAVVRPCAVTVIVIRSIGGSGIPTLDAAVYAVIHPCAIAVIAFGGRIAHGITPGHAVIGANA